MADLIESGQDAAANYPYQDIEDGAGVVTYYSFSKVVTDDTDASQDKTYGLTKDSGVVSVDNTVTLIGTGSSQTCSTPVTSMTNGGTFDFDTPTFRTPRVINGSAEIEMKYDVASDSNNPQNCYPIIKFYRYDGSTETQIGSTLVMERLVSSNSGAQTKTSVARLALPRTKIRKGDLIRVELSMVACKAAGNYVTVTADIGNTAEEDFKVRIPFEVNV